MSEGFEDAFPGGWRVFDWNEGSYGEYYWAKRACRSFSGSYSGWAVGGGANGFGLACGSNYVNDADSWMIYGPFSLVGATAAELSFKAWMNSESEFDELCAGASIDGITFYAECVSGNSNGWIHRVLDLQNVHTLGSLLGWSQVWVTIQFSSDSSENLPEGAYVDDIVLRKCMSPVCQ